MVSSLSLTGFVCEMGKRSVVCVLSESLKPALQPLRMLSVTCHTKNALTLETCLYTHDIVSKTHQEYVSDLQVVSVRVSCIVRRVRPHILT